MKVRNLLACGFLGLFALAAATVITTNTAQGTGRASNADGRVVTFAFTATQVIHNANNHVQGTFDSSQPGATSTDSIKLHINSVTVMTVSANTAGFGGDAILRVQQGTELHYYHGQGRVYPTSNRHIGEAGDPDTIAIHFVPTTSGDPTYDFTG